MTPALERLVKAVEKVLERGCSCGDWGDSARETNAAWREMEDALAAVAQAEPELTKCDYCHGIGACPRCWGRAGIEELKADLASAREAIRLMWPYLQEADCIPNILREHIAIRAVWGKDRVREPEHGRFEPDGEDEITRVKRDLASTRGWLTKHARHEWLCAAGSRMPWRESDRAVCNCGLAEVIPAVRAALSEPK